MKKGNKYSDKELAQAHIFPHSLNHGEKKSADKEIWEIRKRRLQEMDSEKLLIAYSRPKKVTFNLPSKGC